MQRDKEYINEVELAERTGLSRSWLRQRRCYGTPPGQRPGPPYHKFGARVLYKMDDVVAWEEEQKHIPAPAPAA